MMKGLTCLQGRRRIATGTEKDGDKEGSTIMESAKLKIEGMSCEHCVAAVTKALAALPGTEIIDVAIGEASFRYDPAQTSPGAAKTAVEDIGFDVV
jgi:copper chaperone